MKLRLLKYGSLITGVAAFGALGVWAFTPPATATAANTSGYAGIQAGVPAAILGEAPPPRGSSVNYYEADRESRGYLSVPNGEGPFPAVILIHEWNGLVDRVRQMADALADEGYIALAADLYSGQVGTNRDENVSLMTRAQSNKGAVIANLDAAAAFLRRRDDITGKIGTVGWCFGGGIALNYGLGGVNHDATAIFYGSLVTDPAELRALTHEVYGTFAGLDQGIPVDQVHDFASALQSIGVENDIHVYDDVNHGFWLRVEGAPDARMAPAVDAWRRLKDYFDRTLRGD